MSATEYALVDSTGAVVNVIVADSSFQPPGGETMVLLGSSGAGIGWTYANGAFVAPAKPTPTLQQQAQSLLRAPVAVTSTGTPALSGSYGITMQDQAHIGAEVQSIMLNGTFADGSSTVAWPDASGLVHTFSVAEFKAFATAIGAFVAACYKVLNGSSTTLPSAALTIA